MSGSPTTGAERPVGLVRGTSDLLPADFARLAAIEAAVLDRFARSGYSPMSIPVLEFTDLHERKSGAGIVSKLYEISDGHEARVCLRPELTAGIVRAYAEAPEPPALPWRVCVSGPVFRHEAMRPGFNREFRQVGVEMLGGSGPQADGEVIWLAWWTLRELGVSDTTIRIGHVGLILEMLARSGLPEAARAALVERLSEAAAEGRNVGALETALEQLAGWLGAEGGEGEAPAAGAEADPGVDRLFRTLVPDVTGRRSGREILGRLRRKWELGHSLQDVLERLRERVHELAELRGPASTILSRLETDYEDLAPDSVAALRELIAVLGQYGVDLDRVELDLGFGRGIGFYSQMVFEVLAPTTNGPVEVCGGGRYDGLARVLGGDRDDRGVGFAFGLERLAGVVPAGASGLEKAPAGHLIVADPKWRGEAVRLATRMRENGLAAVLEGDLDGDQARDRARQLNRAFVVTVRGPVEEAGSLRVREIATGRESSVPMAVLIPEIPAEESFR